MTTNAILLKAAKLVERGWTRGAGARNAIGEAVSPIAPLACRWCASGAITRAVYTTGAPLRLIDTAHRALINHLELDQAPDDTDVEAVARWNDPLNAAAEAAAGLRGAAEAATNAT